MADGIEPDDIEVVRWYECERRINVPTEVVPLSQGTEMFPCPWGQHWHTGKLSDRRGSGRRVSNARYHWQRHQQDEAAKRAAG